MMTRLIHGNKKQKKIESIIIKDVRNLFRLKVRNRWHHNNIEYESNSDRNKHYQLKNIFIKLDHT